MNTRSMLVRALMAGLLLSVLPGVSVHAQDKPAAEKVGLTEARAIVADLPEVKAWEEKRKAEAAKAGPGQPPGGILTSLRPVKGVKHWAVTLYENPQTEARKWAVFMVRARDGKIFVETDQGKLITLEDWRKTRPAV